jgi:adenylosuccinate synthase
LKGAQGSLLDIDHGTYPYVTSSNATVGGICTGLGISPDKIHSVLGVAKAYATRVGGGPFPTENFGEAGRWLLERGCEFGATTGRPRRCGWFDAFAMAYTCRINGIQKLALMKPDVLDGLEEIKICTGYKYKGGLLESFPTENWILQKVEPQYISAKGWSEPVHHVRDRSSLPAGLMDYIRRIEDLIEVGVAVISTGVERNETILLEEMLPSWMDTDKIKEEINASIR